MKCNPGDWRGSVRGNLLASLMSNTPAGVTCDDICSSLKQKNVIWRKSLCANIITQGCGSAWKSNSTWHEEGGNKWQTRYESITGGSSSTHKCFLLIHRTRLSHTCANEGGCPSPQAAPSPLCVSYLWSWVGCEHRSQMCVPSVYPENQMERAVWTTCWRASSPYRAQACKWRDQHGYMCCYFILILIFNLSWKRVRSSLSCTAYTIVLLLLF